jgi:hypothetical protein
MNAADAARMSDPLLNPHFRRRWAEYREVHPPWKVPDDNLGAIGLALLKAWRNRQELSTKPRRDR